jgi:hypothetical protein
VSPVGGQELNPSAPPEHTPRSTPRKRTSPERDSIEVKTTNKGLFVEFFAGSGVLTTAVASAGVRTAPPNDVATGGFDLSSRAGLDQAKDYLKELSAWTETLMVHLAPPCSTFSRARDRSWKSRLRSKDRPQGLPGCGPWCTTANKVARHSLELAEFAHDELKAVVTLENPHSSYLWGFPIAMWCILPVLLAVHCANQQGYGAGAGIQHGYKQAVTSRATRSRAAALAVIHILHSASADFLPPPLRRMNPRSASCGPTRSASSSTVPFRRFCWRPSPTSRQWQGSPPPSAWQRRALQEGAPQVRG